MVVKVFVMEHEVEPTKQHLCACERRLSAEIKEDEVRERSSDISESGIAKPSCRHLHGHHRELSRIAVHAR